MKYFTVLCIVFSLSTLCIAQSQDKATYFKYNVKSGKMTIQTSFDMNVSSESFLYFDDYGSKELKINKIDFSGNTSRIIQIFQIDSYKYQIVSGRGVKSNRKKKFSK